MKKRSKTPLSLIEITLMILIFSVCASVCMRLFVSANEKANRSGNLACAVGWAQTAADTYKSCGGDHAEAALRLGADLAGKTATVWFDRDWNACAQTEGTFCLTLTDGDPAAIRITQANGEALFALEVKAVPYG